MKRTNFGIWKMSNHYMFLAILTSIMAVLVSGSLFTVSAQPRNIMQAQARMRERMIREQGGSNPSVSFNDDGSFETVSNNETRVRGTGTYRRDRYDNGRTFNYESVFDVRNGNLRSMNYSFTGSGGGSGGGSIGGGGRPSGNVTYTGAITNRHSGKSLDVSERSMREGANVQQWQYANQPNQNWEVIDLGQNSVAIVAQHSGMALTVDGTRDGANVVQRRWRNNNSRQQWSMQSVGGEWYQIRNISSGKCLDVSARSTADGANIQQWSCAGADNQHFRLGGNQVQPPPTQPPTSGSFPVIYAQENFDGPAQAVERDFPGNSDWDGSPHRIRSIRVPPGWNLTVYERRNYSGRSMTLSSNWSSSPGNWWYGRVRSIRVSRIDPQPR